MFRVKSDQPAVGRRWLPVTRRGRLTALAVAVTAVAGGTFAGVATANGGDEGPLAITAHMMEGIPTLTASDWVTHGDHAVVIEMVPGSERRGALPEDKKDNGEGHIPRTATMKVDQVLWSKPGAEAAPKTYPVELLGWWWEGSSEREFAWQGEPRYEEGHKYIALLVKGDDGKWGATSHAMPYDDGKVGTGESAGKTSTGETAGELQGLEKEAHGKNAAAVKQLLEAAQPK